MPFSVQGKSAIVTGAGSGINFAFAKILLANFCNVLIADLSLRPEAKALLEKYSGQSTPNRAIFQQTDVRNWAQLEKMFTTAETAFGEIDIVCPGAGIYEPHWSNFWYPPGSSIESKDSIPESRYATLDINITHPIRTTQLAISHFLDSRHKQQHPASDQSSTDNERNRIHNSQSNRKHILHISSIAGQMPALGVPLYTASKHAISGFVRSLAQLDEKENIRVTAVAPGVVKTPLWLDHPEKLKVIDEKKDEWVTPDEVALVMLALIQQDEVSSAIIGDLSLTHENLPQTISVHGGTILEISKRIREVTPYSDPGPTGRTGNTISEMKVMDEEVVELLRAKGWGMGGS